MRKSLRASVLVLILAFSTHAGEIPCPPIAPPNSTQEATTEGETPNLSLVEVVLTLLTLI